jgi:hypothetical protein
MIHVGLHSVGTYHKKFGGQNEKNKNMVCRVSIEDTRQSAECPVLGSRQRLTAVSFRTAADGPLPSACFAECLTLGKHVFAECGLVPSVLHSVTSLVTESRTLPSAALGKTKGSDSGSDEWKPPPLSKVQRVHEAKTKFHNNKLKPLP